eukprot:1157349-Pelagomonas_calceolata.AAC.9
MVQEAMTNVFMICFVLQFSASTDVLGIAKHVSASAKLPHALNPFLSLAKLTADLLWLGTFPVSSLLDMPGPGLKTWGRRDCGALLSPWLGKQRYR